MVYMDIDVNLNTKELNQMNFSLLLCNCWLSPFLSVKEILINSFFFFFFLQP